MTNTKISLAIIGGGAACVLLLAQLARREAAQAFQIDVYDRSGRFGQGIAYSTRYLCHLLNVRAANMSADHLDKNDFAEWAAPRGFGPADFVPRKLYADYLYAKLQQARKKLKIRFIEQDVISVQREAMAYALTCNGTVTTYDQVVLATGNVSPQRPAVDGTVGGYFDDPWTMDFAALKTADHIALIGSGLSAVDSVLSLREEGYGGTITLFSRNGLFPRPHVDPVPYTSLLKSADEQKSPLSLLHLIRGHIKKAAEHNVPWQSVIDSLRPHTNAIWKNWNDAQKASFQKRLLTFWNVHRHRMAPQIANVIEEWQGRGQIRVVKSAVKNITSGPTVVAQNGDYKMDAVINCLGYRYQERGRIFDAGYKIGPGRFGELFETTAIPEIRAQAFEIAERLAP